MNSTKTDEFLVLIKKNADLLINQTKKAQETLDFISAKSLDTYSVDTPLELLEGKQTLRLNHVGVFNSVFNITNVNNKVAIYTAGYWKNPKIFEILNEIVEQRN